MIFIKHTYMLNDCTYKIGNKAYIKKKISSIMFLKFKEFFLIPISGWATRIKKCPNRGRNCIYFALTKHIQIIHH